MSGIELNLICYFKGIDKYNNMNASLSKPDRIKLENIDKIVRGNKFRDDPTFYTPLSHKYFVRFKCRNYGEAFQVRELVPDTKLKIRARVRRYNYKNQKQGNV